MWFEDFQDGCHGGQLGYQNRTILAILYCPDPSTKFPLHLTYCLGAHNDWSFKMAEGEVVWRFSRWLTWWPSWIFEQNDFSNSKFPCCPNASHQVWAQSNFGFGSRCGFKILKMAAQKWNDLSNSESLCRSDASHQVSAQSNLWFGRRCRLKNFKVLRPSWISERTNFSNSESQ